MTPFGWLMTTYLATLFFGIASLFHPAPRLIWNASASVPIGLYAVHSADTPQIGDLLVIRPPTALAAFLDRRGYLPDGVPLLKHVAALPGQTVCRSGDTVTVDGVALGDALDHDHVGRGLPDWQGCQVVGAGAIFVMNPRSPDSLDGRYFGVLPATSIIGRATPIWTASAP